MSQQAFQEIRECHFCVASRGDGAHAVVVHGWRALVDCLREAMGCPEDEWDEFSDSLIDATNWDKDGSGRLYQFHEGFEDGSIQVIVVDKVE